MPHRPDILEKPAEDNSSSVSHLGDIPLQKGEQGLTEKRPAESGAKQRFSPSQAVVDFIATLRVREPGLPPNL